MAELNNLGLTLTKQIVRTHDKFLVAHLIEFEKCVKSSNNAVS